MLEHKISFDVDTINNRDKETPFFRELAAAPVRIQIDPDGWILKKEGK